MFVLEIKFLTDILFGNFTLKSYSELASENLIRCQEQCFFGNILPNLRQQVTVVLQKVF